MKNKISIFLFSLFTFVLGFVSPVMAAPTDEILNYEITIDVNKDLARPTIHYHVDWLVLESDGVGPLEWVKIGIPNNHCMDYGRESDTIDSMSIISSGGYFARIDLDKKYYEGEVASFDFYIDTDYMYKVNKFTDGYTVFSFTPGWFDDIAVDNLTIKWNMDGVESYSPDCTIEDGYLVWNTSLSPGGKYTVDITYPNDAMNFDLNWIDADTADNVDTVVGVIALIIGGIVGLLMFATPFIIVIIVIVCVVKYSSEASFGGTEKKITRTRVTYHHSCPGCGAVRKEGEQFCTYCGRSFVKSEEIIKEETIKDKDKAILNFKTDGEYRYSSSPNTYIRVHTVTVPKPRPARSYSSSSHHSSCVHSSCACACACACAGGGRAGCTNKDFYNTNLKLKQLEKKFKANK